MDYSLTYFAKSEFSITVTDGDVSECAQIKLPDPSGSDSENDLLSGEYTPIAVIDYDPVTTYAANDVLEQSNDTTFDSTRANVVVHNQL